MATKMWIVGTANWAKVRKPDGKYKKWSICVHDISKEDMAKLKEAKLMIKPRLDDDQKVYYQFGRSTEAIFKGETVALDPPEVTFADDIEGVDNKTLIGNGSKVAVLISYYDTRMGRGHRLERVHVYDLVRYELDEGESNDPPSLDDDEAPAPKKKVTKLTDVLKDEIPF
jgi:hypothetical protein